MSTTQQSTATHPETLSLTHPATWLPVLAGTLTPADTPTLDWLTRNHTRPQHTTTTHREDVIDGLTELFVAPAHEHHWDDVSSLDTLLGYTFGPDTTISYVFAADPEGNIIGVILTEATDHGLIAHPYDLHELLPDDDRTGLAACVDITRRLLDAHLPHILGAPASLAA